MSATALPLRLGISRCLLGDAVRYDGGHKRDPFLVDVLGPHVEWVPVCPEVEVGLGTPRDPMRLYGTPQRSRLLTIRTQIDHTESIGRWSEMRLRELASLALSGYVFKQDSPSCGVERVRIFNAQGVPAARGAGLFARAFQQQFPLTPVEEDGALGDAAVRDNFIERVFAYHRWRCLLQEGVTRQRLIQFHTVHKYVLLAHSPQHYRTLGAQVAALHRVTPQVAAERYGALFMAALALRATVRKHVNVLQHLLGHFRTQLSAPQRRELAEAIDAYRREEVPLLVPLTLMRHYVRVFDVPYVREQVYLNPHPKELLLRNHV